MKEHKLINYKGNVVLDIVRHKSSKTGEYRYSVLLTFSQDNERQELYTIMTDVDAPSEMDAMKIGLESLALLYINIASIVTVYDGDSGVKVNQIDMNKLTEAKTVAEAAAKNTSTSSNSELMESIYTSKSLH